MKIIEFKNVTKTFLNGKIVANNKISFSIQKGEIHAIAGENGAGKSTLLSMLFGLYQPNSGQILFKGKTINYHSAADAIKAGLGMVQQHFQLVKKYTVGQNILLGKEPNKYNIMFKKEAYAKIDKLAEEYDFGIKSKQKISSLTVGQEQKTEILKLLYSDAEVFIFDEPTAMLIPQEIEHLLEVIKTLKQKGKTIILITHKLAEIKAVADRVSVIRRGKYVGELNQKTLTAQKLATLMVGGKINVAKKEKTKIGTPVMKVKNLVVKEKGYPKLKGISFEIAKGEILAIAGVEGNGQSELANAILGLTKIASGDLEFYNSASAKEKPILLNNLSISKRNDLVNSIPEDRHEYGMVLDLKIYENMVLKTFWKDYARFGILNRLLMKKNALKIINQYDVRGSDGGNAIARGLSGGNQQKAVVGREITANHDLMVVFQATRGLDIGAVEYIHQQILNSAQRGSAILLISYDIAEVMKLADRVLVFNNGIITGELTGEKINQNQLGILMSSNQEVVNV